MDDLFDSDTIERFRTMAPRDAYERAKDAVYQHGAVTSEEFNDVYEELVRRGVLTWTEIEEFRR
jgi:hypothetical protein